MENRRHVLSHVTLRMWSEVINVPYSFYLKLYHDRPKIKESVDKMVELIEKGHSFEAYQTFNGLGGRARR